MKLTKIAFIAAIAGASVAAQADVLVDTFGPTGLGYFPSFGPTTNAGQYLGKTFAVGSDYTLSQIDVAIRMFGDSDQMSIVLRADVAGQPSTVLESFTITNMFGTSTGGVYSLTSATNPLMTAGTYYVTIEPINDATGRWCLTNSAMSGALVTSTDGGSSWTHYTDTNGTVRVQGASAVPEPASMICLAAGLVALVKRKRR